VLQEANSGRAISSAVSGAMIFTEMSSGEAHSKAGLMYYLFSEKLGLKE
jgi:hypothetical protein